MNLLKKIIRSYRNSNSPKYPEYSNPKEMLEYFSGLSDDDLKQQLQGIKDLAQTFKHPEALPSWVQLQNALITQIMEERGLSSEHIKENPPGRLR